MLQIFLIIQAVPQKMCQTFEDIKSAISQYVRLSAHTRLQAYWCTYVAVSENFKTHLYTVSYRSQNKEVKRQTARPSTKPKRVSQHVTKPQNKHSN